MTYLILLKISPTLSSFEKNLKDTKWSAPFGARRFYIIHQQLRNCSSNLYKDLFDHYLSDSNYDCKTEESFILFFKCPAYNTIRDVLFENIFKLHINEPLTFELLLFGNPNLDIMTDEAIFESVNEYMKLSNRIIVYML